MCGVQRRPTWELREAVARSCHCVSVSASLAELSPPTRHCSMWPPSTDGRTHTSWICPAPCQAQPRLRRAWAGKAVLSVVRTPWTAARTGVTRWSGARAAGQAPQRGVEAEPGGSPERSPQGQQDHQPGHTLTLPWSQEGPAQPLKLVSLRESGRRGCAVGSLPSMSSHHLLPREAWGGRSHCVSQCPLCSVRSEAAEGACTGSIRGWRWRAPGQFGHSLGGCRAPVPWLTGVMLAD